MSDAIEQFRAAIRAAGLVPPDDIQADGKLHRFPSNGKRKDTAGYYKLHLDATPAGFFGCWRSGVSETWHANIGRTLTEDERRAQRQRIEEMRVQRDAEDARRKAEAAKTAAALWKAATPAGEDHPYLRRKGVSAVETLREIQVEDLVRAIGYPPKASGEPLAGRVLVAPVKIGDNLSSIEMIDETGRKSALAGGAKAGGYWAAQALPEGDGAGVVVLVGEGVATVLSAREATGHLAVAALSAGQLEAAARSIRDRHPRASIVVLADLLKDSGRPDERAAQAARAVGGIVAVPDFGNERGAADTDFNDMAQRVGLAAVRRAIEAALASPEQAAIAEPTVELVRASDVRIEAVRWLWDGWLAAGKLHVLAGAPGGGKTTIALALAATLTLGGRWPDGTRARQGSVVVWSGEDDPADVLVPRLAAMGADLDRVVFVGDAVQVADGRARRLAFDPGRDMELLAARIKANPPALLIVDPIVSAVAGDSHKNAEVRRGLQPLVDLARECGTAVLGISHFSKGTQGRDPTERVTGSLAFGALARLVLLAAKRKDDDGNEQRVLMRSKSNIGRDDGGFVYALEQREVPRHPGVFASCLTWGEPIEGSARDVLATAEVAPEPDEERTATDEAVEHLRQILLHGPVGSRETTRAMKDAGFTDKVIRRARESLRVEIRRTGFGPKTITHWSLPNAQSCPREALLPRNPNSENGAEMTERAGVEAGEATDDDVEVL